MTPNGKFNLNMSYGIYESNSDEFFNLCNKFNYAPKKKIVEDTKLDIQMETVQFERKKKTSFTCKRSLPMTASQEFLKHKVSKASDKIKGDAQVSF